MRGLSIALIVALSGCGRCGYSGFAAADADPFAPDADPSVIDADPNAPDGALTGPRVDLSLGPGANPDVVFNGVEFTVVFEEDASMKFARVSSAGVVQAETTVVGPNIVKPAVAALPNRYAVTAENENFGETEILAGEVSASGVLLAELNASNTAGRSENPVISAGSDVVCIAWIDDTDGTNQLFAWNQNPSNGNPYTPNAVQITASAEDAHDPDLLCSDGQVIAMWGQPALHHGRFNYQGQELLDAVDVSTTGMDAHDVALAFTPGDGQGFIAAAWVEGESGAGAVRYRLMNIGGSPLDDDITLSDEGSSAPAIAARDNTFMLAWSAGGDIFATRISTSGFVDLIKNFTTSPSIDRSPSVAISNTGETALVWEEVDEGTGATVIRVVIIGVN